ncbi:PHD-finger family protein [Aphelenchoides avenae]|nr:PHD-finger family protein [Aphelenchus avenae]
MESESSTKESTPVVGGVVLFSRRGRSIKPNAAFLAGGDFAAAGEESDDDEDFEGEHGSSDEGNSESGSDEDGDEAEDSESDEDEEGTDADDEEGTDTESPAGDAMAAAASTSRDADKKQVKLVCSICLNCRPQVEKDEVIQCDKCGLAVHEACYGADNGSDSDSQTSSASTEPWFCEPCMFGLDVPPFCELCPSRYGAFKKSDVGGGWVHLLCGVYTHGISFGDAEHCSAVSWQEMDYKAFGRKACNGCLNSGSDRVSARVGVVSQCEAGMCKNFYHISCAQRMGFLVEPDSDENVPSSSQEHIHYLLCKKHNDPEVVQRKRELYAQFLKQEDRRMAMCRRRVLSEREEKKRIHLRNKYEKRVEALRGTHITLPPLDAKRPKMLHASAQFLEAFAEKAELLGMDRKEFNEQFMRLPAEQIPTIPLAFTETAVRYYSHREEHVFDEEEKRLEETKKEKQEKVEEKEHLDETLSSVSPTTTCYCYHCLFQVRNMQQESKKRANDAKALIDRFHSALTALGVKKLSKPTVPIKPKPEPKPTTSKIEKPSDMPQLTAESTPPPEVMKFRTPTKITPLNASPSPKRPLPRILQKRGLHSPQKAANPTTSAENAPPASAETNEETKSAVRRLLDDTRKPLASNVLDHPNGTEAPPILSPVASPASTSGKTTPDGHRKRSTPQAKRRRSSIPLASPTLSAKEEPEERDASSPEMSQVPEEPKECFTCKKTTDEHRMIFCTTCKHDYHLGCLDPPLTKMPKLRTAEQFECAECASRSESEHEEAVKQESPEEDLDLSVAERRKSRKRAAAMKEHPKLLEAKETARAFQNLMREESRLKNIYLRAKAEQESSVSPEKPAKKARSTATRKRPASKASTDSTVSTKPYNSRLTGVSPMPTLSPEAASSTKSTRLNGAASRQSTKSDDSVSLEMNGGRSSVIEIHSDSDDVPPTLDVVAKSPKLAA